MSEDDNSTRRMPAGAISLADRVVNIESMCKAILEQENVKTTDIALIKSKLSLHDWFIGGICSAVGLSVVAAILIKVIH